MIGYAIGAARTRETIRNMMVGERVKSDHHPIVVNFEVKEDRREKRKKKRTGERQNWTEAKR